MFDGIILGVIAEGAELDASDPIVGDPASSYQPAAANRWFWENNDVLTISADRRTLTIDSIRVGSSQPYSDTIRVIIQAPEPGPAGLFALGLAAFGAARRRGARLSSPG